MKVVYVNNLKLYSKISITELLPSDAREFVAQEGLGVVPHIVKLDYTYWTAGTVPTRPRLKYTHNRPQMRYWMRSYRLACLKVPQHLSPLLDIWV